MSQGLKNKTVIVTGAGAGIGLGIVKSCVDAGASVIMAEINPQQEVVANSLRDEGADIFFYEVDVSDAESIKNFISVISQKFDRIDGLVNNAGVTIEGDFLDFPIQKLEKMWTTNLRSVFLMCQGIARIMKAQKSGAIVNISSNHTQASVPDYEMYAATKAGIAAMSRSMCWSLGRHGIRVNTLCPGLTHTEAVDDLLKDKPQLLSTFNNMHATGTYNTVKQIGDAAVFLLSEASEALTGSTIVADQGLAASLCKVEDLKD